MPEAVQAPEDEDGLGALYDQSLTEVEFERAKSKDPSTKVGARAWRTHRKGGQVVAEELSAGHNRFPDGVDGDPRRYAMKKIKYAMTLHAETMTVSKAARDGVKLAGANLSVDAMPCTNCACVIAETRFGKVVTDGSTMVPEGPAEKVSLTRRWAGEFKLGKDVLDRGGVGVELRGVPKGADPWAMIEESVRNPPPDAAKPRSFVPEILDHKARPPVPTGDAVLDGIVARAEKLREQSPIAGDQQAIIVYDNGGRVLLETSNRYPNGTNPADFALPGGDGAGLPEDDRLARMMEQRRRAISAERAVVSQAASQGIAMKGSQIYGTTVPRGQDAVMIATAGISQATFDARHLDRPMDADTALELWAGKTVLEEAGVMVNLTNVPPGLGRDPYAKVKDVLAREMPEVLELLPERKQGNRATMLVGAAAQATAAAR